MVDSESIHLGYVLVQPTYPGPQPRPQGDLHLATTVYFIAREKTAVVTRPHLLREIYLLDGHMHFVGFTCLLLSSGHIIAT